MTIKSKGTFLCDHFLMDTNGKSSVIGIFKQFNVVKLPAQIGRFYIVSFTHATGLENGNPVFVAVGFKIIGPNGSEIGQKLPTLPIKFDSENKDAMVSIEVNGYSFNQEGRYEIVLYQEDQTIDKVELLISVKR